MLRFPRGRRRLLCSEQHFHFGVLGVSGGCDCGLGRCICRCRSRFVGWCCWLPVLLEGEGGRLRCSRLRNSISWSLMGLLRERRFLLAWRWVGGLWWENDISSECDEVGAGGDFKGDVRFSDIYCLGDGPIVCDNNEHPPGRAPKPRRRSVYPPPGCWDADMHSTRLQSHTSDMDRQ